MQLVKDYLLIIPFESSEQEEQIQSQLYLTASTGSTSTEDAITAYFDSPEARDEAKPLLKDFDVTEAERERVDWLQLYQQSLEPMEIGRTFIVAPDPALMRDSPRTKIIVPQEQAFGTGSHETTSLCVEILETLQVEGKRCLDIGTGSGILAIAMQKLGAAKVIAFDNDPDAYAAMRDNRIRNAVPEESMPLFIGGVEALRAGRFDIVTMNIIPEVIIPLLPLVVRRMKDALMLSGILIVKRGEIVEAAEKEGLSLADERMKGEWWAGVFRRASNSPPNMSLHSRDS